MFGKSTNCLEQVLLCLFTTRGVITSLLLLGSLWFIIKVIFPSEKLANFPGPRILPFPLCTISYFRAVRQHRGMHNLQQHFYNKYGKISKIWTPTGGDKLIVGDPEIIKRILVKEFHRFPERGFAIKLVPPLDSELFTCEYSRWKRLRRVLAPIFSAARLKEIVPILMEGCCRLEAKINKEAELGKSTDVFELSALFVLDIILSANFGVDTKDLQTNCDKTFLNRARRVFSRPLLAAFLGTFPFLAPIVGRFTDVLGNAGLFISLAENIIKQRKEQQLTGRRDALQSISYLEWVLLETLRIVPIGYRHFRKCLETCTIDGICFPKGVSIDIAVYSLHHDPNIWPQPQRFIPQRFSPEETEKRHPFAFLPFGQGPRICIGQRLALLIMKVALVKVLEKYELQNAPETPENLTLESSNMLKSKDTIYLQFKARSI